MTMSRRTFRIPDPIYDPAKEKAAANDESVSAVVRRGLEEYVASDEDKS